MKLEIKNLSKKIGDKIVLKNISLFLSKKESLAIIGGNGTGKSTLLNIISGFDKKYDGKIIRNNIKMEKIGYVPQDIILFDEFSVKDNIEIFKNKKYFSEMIYKKLYEILKIDEIYKKRIDKLSGGQKRRVNFLVGLMNSPDIILLDEAIVGIEKDIVNDIIYFLNEYGKDKIMIITSHDVDFLKRISNRYVVLKDGEIMEEVKYE